MDNEQYGNPLHVAVSAADLADVTPQESIADKCIRYLQDEKGVELRLRRPPVVTVDPSDLSNMDEDTMAHKSLGLAYQIEHLDAMHVYNRTRALECELAVRRLSARLTQNLKEINRTAAKEDRKTADDIENIIDTNEDIHRLREEQLSFRCRADLVDSHRSACSLLLRQISRYITFAGQELDGRMGLGNVRAYNAHRSNVQQSQQHAQTGDAFEPTRQPTRPAGPAAGPAVHPDGRFDAAQYLQPLSAVQPQVRRPLGTDGPQGPQYAPPGVAAGGQPARPPGIVQTTHQPPGGPPPVGRRPAPVGQPGVHQRPGPGTRPK